MQASLIAFMISLVLSALLLPWLIIWMRSHDEGQQIRDEGPKWHEKKSGTGLRAFSRGRNGCHLCLQGPAV